MRRIELILSQSLLDLMGDESTPASSSSAPASRQQTTQDLLADIFGMGEDTPSAATPPAAAPKSATDDILSLFGSTSLSPQATGSSCASSPPSASLAASAPAGDFFSTVSSTPAVSTPPVPTGPVAHEAYNGDGLRITLTPVRDANNPLLVNIMARFTATQPVQSVNFQAAVPKVCLGVREGWGRY